MNATVNQTMSLTVEQKARIAAGTLQELVSVEFRSAKQAFLAEIERTGYVMAYAYAMPRLAQAEIQKTQAVYIAQTLRGSDPVGTLQALIGQYQQTLADVMSWSAAEKAPQTVQTLKAQGIVWAIDTVKSLVKQLS